jgi:catalase
MNDQSKRPPLAHASGTPVTDNFNIQTAGPRGPALLQDVWLIEKLAHFAREVIPERRMHAKGSGAHGTFRTTSRVKSARDPDVRPRARNRTLLCESHPHQHSCRAASLSDVVAVGQRAGELPRGSLPQ